ncbi:MAG: hypothetical protein ACR2G4_15240 [Pyrinomonadaceae bacterium]
MSASAIIENSRSTKAQAPMSLALRNLCLTFALTLTALAVVGYAWKQTGYEMLIVAMGWPHVILGFLFFFGKVLRGERGARLAFLLLAALTLLIWTAHYVYAITGLIYVYFLYHAFRDEIFVYLQTRSRHQLNGRVFATAGITPLILLLLLISQPQDYRQDMRRVELTGAQLKSDGWSLMPFKEIPQSRGLGFYFYLQAPGTEEPRAFLTDATTSDSRSDGEIRVSDEKWPQASDLVFRPQYAGEQLAPDAQAAAPAEMIQVQLTGGHRVGQTFTAERDDLSGIWLPTYRLNDEGLSTQFILRLASPPLLPLSNWAANLRWILIALLGIVLLWRVWPGLWENRQFWLYLAIFAVTFLVLQTVLKTASRASYAVPMIFQFVVVFHYFSWYVFSFDKLRALSGTAVKAPQANSRYDRLLASLRRAPRFMAVVAALSLLSAAGAIWYYQFNGPTTLRYAFDYNYFLYFLVFHVTFSFCPKQPPRVQSGSAHAVS